MTHNFPEEGFGLFKISIEGALYSDRYAPPKTLFDKTTMPPINLYNIGPSKDFEDAIRNASIYGMGYYTTQTEENTMKTTRSSVLAEADTIVNGARADQYGGPEDSFQKIASLWTAYLSSMDEEVNISASDVACMMTLLKVARLCNSPDHKDSWVDVAGYAACGAEVASSQAPDAGQQYAKEQMQSSYSDECAWDVEPTQPFDHHALGQAMKQWHDVHQSMYADIKGNK